MANQKQGELLQERAEVRPTIYVYRSTHQNAAGLLKVGYTTRDAATRVEEQENSTKHPFTNYEILLEESAMRSDGTSFTDHDVHRALEQHGVRRVEGEWFRCGVREVRAAIVAVRNRTDLAVERTRDFGMRPEQARAVAETLAYYRKMEAKEPGVPPRFLWNAKMRFGKTFAAYQLAKAMEAKRVLILTFKPAVLSAWQEDCETHIDFKGWQFIHRPEEPGMPNIADQYAATDGRRPIICFGSFQDFLGYNRETGGIKEHHEWVREETWDLVIFDEYHFGAWRRKAQDLFTDEDEERVVSDAEEEAKVTGESALTERDLPITAKHYLYLSGTPFRSLATGEFIEEQVYGWTYGDEQRAKENWQGPGPNPYAALPKMVMLTYKVPEKIRRVAQEGEFDEFDLGVFFSVDKRTGRFVYEEYVQQWLDFLRGRYKPEEGLKGRPPLPYGDSRLLNALQHTLWFLPSVAACEAMEALLGERHNAWWHDYEVVNCAGSHTGMGAKALDDVRRAMANPLASKSITLTCGKLTTGVTVRPWGGILMLRNLRSPETYFQAAFRVQSPWTTKEEGREVVVKPVCYVLDFAPNRALRQVSDYSSKLTINSDVPGDDEERVGEFIHFLPILYSDGGAMRQIDAREVLDLADNGLSANLLARRWKSALLVNVDNETLKRLMADARAMAAINKIEAFRKLNESGDVLQMIVARDEAIKDVKREGKKKDKETKKELTQEEKEIKSKRKAVQELLIKFAQRIPIFMYLTDDREHCLKEVIQQSESALFEQITGLTLEDFACLLRLKVFDDDVMNTAVRNFKRYEDNSLTYTGIDKHEGESVGAWDTVIPRDVYTAE